MAQMYSHLTLAIVGKRRETQMTNERIVRTTIRVPEGLLKKCKIRGIETGMSFQELVVEALKAYLKEGR